MKIYRFYVAYLVRCTQYLGGGGDSPFKLLPNVQNICYFRIIDDGHRYLLNKGWSASDPVWGVLVKKKVSRPCM
jgi:hypothetical protein